MQDNPTLNRGHIDRIRSVAQLRSVRSGKVLYEPSCPDVPLFVVLDGTVTVSRTGEDDKILAVREPGQFTGEMSVISGSRSLLTARCRQLVMTENPRKRRNAMKTITTQYIEIRFARLRKVGSTFPARAAWLLRSLPVAKQSTGCLTIRRRLGRI